MAAMTIHSPILFLLLSLPRVSSLVFNFNFSQPNGYDTAELNIIHLNSTHLNSDEGSNGTDMRSGGIDQVLYSQPVLLWDDFTGENASFTMSTAFCLRIYQGVTSSYSTESRVAFFLGPYGRPAVRPPSSYGTNHSNDSNGTTSNDQVMSVEFDAYLQEKLDSSGNNYMVSVDVNYIVSKIQVNTTFPGNSKNRSSGCMMIMKAQIDYNGCTKRLVIGLRIDNVSHHINQTVDLRRSLPREVAVGFLSSTGQPIELRNVLHWSLSSTLGHANSSVMLPKMEPESEESRSSMATWKQILVSLEPWNWSVELSLQFQFQRIWERLNLALSSTFNVSLNYIVPDRDWNLRG